MFHLQILYVVTCYSVAVPIVSLAAVANMTVATGSLLLLLLSVGVRCRCAVGYVPLL